MFDSIKAKVISVFSLVMVAFTFILLITISINERDHILDLELDKSSEMSKMHASLLSQEFNQYVLMLQMLSDNPLLKSGDKSAIVRQLERLMTVGKGNFINAIYIDKDLNLTDLTGSTQKVSNPLFLQGEQWAGKEYNISVPLYSWFEKIPVIIVSVPLLDEQQEWIGTIGVALPLSILSDKLAAIKLAKESYAWLADSNELVVSHPRKNVAMNVNLKYVDNSGYPGFSEIFKQTELQNDGYGRYMDKLVNEAKIVTFSKIDYLPGWTLYVTTKESAIFHDINAILYNVLITSMILMVVFLLLISHLANRLTRPIIQLTNDVKTSAGITNSSLKVIDSNDEIGQLSKAFHDSIREIHIHTNHLENMVSHRTQEIYSKNLLLNEQNDKLEELASKDPLTHLYNRRAFSVLVDKEMTRAQRHHFPVTLAILDIDHFKKINDSFGHNVGDDILCQFAHELSVNIRKENSICRWGGEEFVILILHATSDMVFKHLDEVREKIALMDFAPVERLTFSAGLASIRDDESFEEWFQRADKALYKAKESGRNRILKD